MLLLLLSSSGANAARAFVRRSQLRYGLAVNVFVALDSVEETNAGV